MEQKLLLNGYVKSFNIQLFKKHETESLRTSENSSYRYFHNTFFTYFLYVTFIPFILPASFPIQ